MRKPARLLTLLAVFSLGYFAGTAQWHADSRLNAQGFGQAPDAQGDELTEKIGEAFAAVQTARGVLDQDALYNPATKTVNVTGILSGGVDAIADLESGRGVDPETFAALYAGMGTDEISAELDKDELGRLTYKGKVVRMYSISRLKLMFQERLRYTGEDVGFVDGQ